MSTKTPAKTSASGRKASQPALANPANLAPKPAKRHAPSPAAKHVVMAALSGGYRVYGTPVEPKHTTRELIAQAVAAVK